MFAKLLIANRGEIAVRIARTARRMGLAAVAVYSDADAGAAHVAACDEAVRIGPATAADSYLRIDRIVAAALETGAGAIHPGYGFLAENAALAEACGKAGLVFVGPSPEAMRKLGDKAAAKTLARRIGVPVVPGYSGHEQSLATFKKEAGHIGFPLLIKAAAGGGGRGMRVVREAGDLPAAVESARREAGAAFGDGRLLLERLIERPRHVEVQVFADRHGNVVHLFERECSLQRRHQKVVEEAPAPGMSAGLRSKLTGAAVALARAAGYEGAGTVEFLVEGGGLHSDAPFYFIEVNTRLQVEHPVTEQITGLDLVEWQLRVAAGEVLPLGQDGIQLVSPHASAIELRVCAEDPSHGFLPSTGRLLRFRHEPLTPGTRLETGVREGDDVPPFYDSMIAKLVVAEGTRADALRQAAAELDRLEVAGPRTNIRFLSNLIADEDVRAGRMDTGLVDRKLERLASAPLAPDALHHAFEALLAQRSRSAQTGWAHDPWNARDRFQLGPPRTATYTIGVDGRPSPIETGRAPDVAEPGEEQSPPVGPGAGHFLVADGPAILVVDRGVQARVSWPSDDFEVLHAGESEDTVRAPITGRIAQVLTQAGALVGRGDRIAIVEAMKMEHVLHAPCAGVVARLAVKPGDQVAEGALIAEITGQSDERDSGR